MNDNPQVAEAHQRVATQNAQVAVQQVQELRSEFGEKLAHLEALVRTQHEQIAQLHQKYNLMLTKRFDHGSTTE